MEKTGCKIICVAPTTLAVKGLMMMMMMNHLDTQEDVSLNYTFSSEAFVPQECGVTVKMRNNGTPFQELMFVTGSGNI